MTQVAEFNQCPVCTQTFPTGKTIEDTAARVVHDGQHLTGLGWCPDCAARRGDGFVAMIEIEEADVLPDNTPLRADKPRRTGRIGFLRRQVWEHFSNAQVPDEMVVFVGPKTMKEVDDLIASLVIEAARREREHLGATLQ